MRCFQTAHTGLGYTGVGAASYFKERGWSVTGTTRTQEKLELLNHRGFNAVLFDPVKYQGLDCQAMEQLCTSTHILSTVPPRTGNGEVDPVLQYLKKHSPDIWNTQDQRELRWVGYISSTGVYGDHQGGWVDEFSQVKANSLKGKSRIRAEEAWRQLHHNNGVPVHIFRCAGIYGPRAAHIESSGRSALDAVTKSSPTERQRRRAAQKYISRCHVYDICQVIEASTHNWNPGAVYNVCDDDPAPRDVVMHYARSLLNLDREDDRRSDAHHHQLVETIEEKRVRNDRIKSELKVQLAFATYKEGLSAIAAGDERPFCQSH